MELTPEQLLKIQLVEYKEQPYDSLRCAKALANVLTMFDALRTRLAACEQENARLREALNAVLFDVRENGGILPTTLYRYAKELKGE